MSEELATTGDTEVTLHGQQAVAALADEFGEIGLTLPLVLLSQGTSEAVKTREANIGDWYNTLTGEVVGEEFEFIVCAVHKGRFWEDPSKEVKISRGGDVIPHDWDHPDAGKPWAESLDTEEGLNAAIAAGTAEWGSGPAISTTYNFTGFTPDDPSLPFLISLKRIHTPAAKKLIKLLRVSPAPWSNVYVVGSQPKETDNGMVQVATVKRTPVRPDEETARIAHEYAEAIAAERARYVGQDEDDKPAKPKPNGEALKV